jgi:hypothetical protein
MEAFQVVTSPPSTTALVSIAALHRGLIFRVREGKTRFPTGHMENVRSKETHDV